MRDMNRVTRPEFDAKFQALLESMRELRADMRELRAQMHADVRDLKRTIIVTAISSVLAISAIFIGSMSVWFSAFDKGQELGGMVREIHQMQAELRETQRQIIAERQAQPPQKK